MGIPADAMTCVHALQHTVNLGGTKFYWCESCGALGRWPRHDVPIDWERPTCLTPAMKESDGATDGVYRLCAENAELRKALGKISVLGTNTPRPSDYCEPWDRLVTAVTIAQDVLDARSQKRDGGSIDG